MNREEAIKYGTEWLKDEYLDARDGAFIEISLKALEQMPVTTTAGEGGVIYYPQVEGVTPTVVNPIKTGHWIMSDDGLYRPICDNCGAHPWKGYIPTVEEATEVFKYCPSCGSYNGGD